MACPFLQRQKGEASEEASRERSGAVSSHSLPALHPPVPPLSQSRSPAGASRPPVLLPASGPGASGSQAAASPRGATSRSGSARANDRRGGGGTIDQGLGALKFLDLGKRAANIVCIGLQPEMLTTAFRNAGFKRVCSAQEFLAPRQKVLSQDDLGEASALVLLSQADASQEEALDLCRELNGQPDAPPIIVVLHPTPGKQREPSPAEVAREQGSKRAAASSALMTATAEAQLAFFDAGADEVICPMEDERIMAHRMEAVVSRCANAAARAAQHISDQVSAVQAQLNEKLQHFQHAQRRKFLWQMPGMVLDGIPAIDTKLKEDTSEVGDYAFTEVLGKGDFGLVYRSTSQRFGEVAIKVIVKMSIEDPKIMLSLDREFVLMLQLPQSPYVVTAWEVLHGRDALYLVMEYAGSQHLHDFAKTHLEKQGGEDGSVALPLELVESFCLHATSAVAHLHEHHVCHRDLQPSNFIVIDEAGAPPRLKLTDFGLATLVASTGQRLHEQCGSPPFCAPEALRCQADGYQGYAADIWSLAVLAVELDHGPNGVEKALGWIPKAPETTEAKVADMVKLPSLLRERNPVVRSVKVAKFLERALLLEPSERYMARRLLGQDCLDAQLPPEEVPATEEVAEAKVGDLAKLQQPAIRSAKVAQVLERALLLEPSEQHVADRGLDPQNPSDKEAVGDGVQLDVEAADTESPSATAAAADAEVRPPGHPPPPNRVGRDKPRMRFKHQHNMATKEIQERGREVLSRLQNPANKDDPNAPVDKLGAGSGSLLNIAVKDMFEHVLKDPYMKPLFGVLHGEEAMLQQRRTCSRLVGKYLTNCTPMMKEKLRSSHHELNITDHHFDCYVDHFRKTFGNIPLYKEAIASGAKHMLDFRKEILGGYRSRVRGALERAALPAWRQRIRAKAEGQTRLDFLTAFVTNKEVAESPASELPRLFLPHLACVPRRLVFEPRGADGTAPPEVRNLQDAVEVAILTEDLQFALRAPAFSEEDVETVMLLACESLHQNRIDREFSEAAAAAPPECTGGEPTESINQKLLEEMSRRFRTRFFAEREGMPKCLARLWGAVGTQTAPSVAELARSHRDLGLDDKHYDTFLEALDKVLESPTGEPKAGTPELLRAVRSLRPRVLFESCWRQAEARDNRKLAVSPHEHMGPFFAQVQADQRIGAFFSGTKVPHLRQAQLDFFSELFQGRVTSKMIEKVSSKHDKWLITHYHFDCYMEHVRKVLFSNRLEHELPTSDIYLALGRMEALRPHIVKVGQTASIVPKSPYNSRLSQSSGGGQTGGVVNLDAVTTTAFDMASDEDALKDLVDDRLRFAPPCMHTQIPHMLHQCVRGRPPNLEAIRAAHENLFITASNFAAFSNALDGAMRTLGFDESRAERVRATLAQIEDAVTNGHRQRQIIAATKIATDPTLLQQTQISNPAQVIHRWYDQMGEDHHLDDFFGPDRGIGHSVRREQSKLLVELMKGKMEYDRDEIQRIHAHMDIKPHHFASFLRCLYQALRAEGVGLEDSDLLVELFNSMKSDVVLDSLSKLMGV